MLKYMHDVFVVFSADVNECLSNPCQAGGQCVDEQQRYTCDCPEGRTGYNCQYSASGMSLVLYKHVNTLRIDVTDKERYTSIHFCFHRLSPTDGRLFYA